MSRFSRKLERQKLKEMAKAIRSRKGNLCLCDGESRFDHRAYTSVEQSKADTRPADICEQCNLPKLIHRFIANAEAISIPISIGYKPPQEEGNNG